MCHHAQCFTHGCRAVQWQQVVGPDRQIQPGQ
jgi:hypothetical protein